MVANVICTEDVGWAGGDATVMTDIKGVQRVAHSTEREGVRKGGGDREEEDSEAEEEEEDSEAEAEAEAEVKGGGMW